MKRVLRFRVLVALLLGLVSALTGAAGLEQRAPAGLVLGAEDSWPPYADDSGRGISVDLDRGLKIIKDSGLYADIIKTSKFVYK